MNLRIICGVLIVIGTIILINRCSVENFKVLGTLSNQKQVYYNCLSECERSDPGKRLSPTHGNMMCQEYCESEITKMTRKGGASFPEENQIPFYNVKSNIDESYEKCGEGTKGNKCRSDFTTNYEINEICKQNCEYSTLGDELCMELCNKAYSGNKSIGWNWK